MREVKAIIEKGSDGLYAVRTEFKIGRSYPGGYGESVEEAKEELKVVFKYDMPSFFNYFDFINVSKFAALVGINESKLRQYKSGIAYPGEKTTKKIISAVGKIASELSSARL